MRVKSKMVEHPNGPDDKEKSDEITKTQSIDSFSIKALLQYMLYFGIIPLLDENEDQDVGD